MSNINKIRYNGEYYDIGSNNNYSTEEQVIGTWIDGKPLYRKVYNINLPSTAGDVSTSIILDSNINIINITGYTYYSNTLSSKIILNSFIDDEHRCSIYHYILHNEIRCFVGSALLNLPATVILEYTKTTD